MEKKKLYLNVWPISDEYRGLYRKEGYFAYLKGRELKKYLEALDENGHVVFSEIHAKYMLNICEHFNSLKSNIRYEVIAYGDLTIQDCEYDKQFEFLGFDISGDSYYHSSLFRTFFENCTLKNSIFLQLQKEFKLKLNKNGLFSEKDDALVFSEHVKSFNTSTGISFFEEDVNIRPIAIYGYVL